MKMYTIVNSIPYKCQVFILIIAFNLDLYIKQLNIKFGY